MESSPKRESGVTERLKRGVLETFTDKRRFYRSRGNFPGRAERRLREVMAFAEELHHEQMRSDGQSHIDHLLRVAQRVIRWRTPLDPNPLRPIGNLVRYGTRLDVDLMSAALLHDSVEDQSARLAAEFDALPQEKIPRALPSWQERFSSEHVKALQYLSYRFGEDVARLVAGVTIVKPPGRDAESRKEYVQHYYATVSKTIARRKRRLFLIKLADFYDNAVGLETVESDEKRVALAEKYMAVYRLFIDRLERMQFSIAKHNRDFIKEELMKAERVAEGIVAREGTAKQG